MTVIKPSGVVYGARHDVMAAVTEIAMPFAPIARQVFPPMPVKKSTGSFGRRNRENFNNSSGEDGLVRSGSGKTKKKDFRIGQIEFATKERSIALPYSDQDRADLEDVFDLEVGMADSARMDVLLQEEINAAARTFNETTFPIDGVSGFQASVTFDSASAAPKTEAARALDLLLRRNGNPMDATGVVSYKTFLDMLIREGLVNDKRYVQTPSLLVTDQNRAAVAAQLGFKELKVGTATYNSAGEGLTPVNTSVWGDNYMLVANLGSENADPYQYCLGRTFYHEGFLGLGQVDVYRDDDTRSDMLRYGTNLESQVNYQNLGVLIRIRF